jgi:AcrR family transcriptional regulator
MSEGAQTRESARAPIVAAARRCFRERGVSGTRMDDVARAAGLSRQSVYRYVSGREELVELALAMRTREFADELRPSGPVPADGLREAFVELIVASVRIGRDDPEFLSLMEALPQSRLGPLTTSQRSPIHDAVWHAFAPLLEAGRAADLLRPDASDHDLVEWLQAVISFFAPRTDLDDTAQRRRIRLFVLPALLR